MIVSCGEALVDLVPPPVPGGGPLNVAVAVARLGGPSAFVGCLSTDAYGEQLVEHLTANGVEISACQRSTAPTARAIVEHVPELRFRFDGSGTADTMMSKADLSSLGDPPHILHGGTLGLFRGQTAEVLATTVEAHDGLVSLDPNIRPQIIDDRERWDHYHQRWLACTDLYKASDEDLAWIWPDRSTESCVDHLLESGVQAVIMTRGADGLSIHTPQSRIEVEAPPVEVVDTVGAGDTIVGTVLVSLWELDLAGGDDQLSSLDPSQWQAIADRAVSAAALTCSRAGADVPGRDELDW
jgi:fructokinase